MKKIILLLCVIAFAGIALAQQPTIKGKIVNQNESPVANASVYLVTATAKGVLKTTVTNEVGEYTFVNYPAGKMMIEVTAVGFAKASSDIFDGQGTHISMPLIILSNHDKEIEAVSVTGQLPLIQSQYGKLIMNVENSTLAAGNNALEVLKRAPGVAVDQNDNISLMGQQGVMVTIDGRQTYMSGEQLATLLKSMDASQIKTIEVANNRSAKDDAEGAAGNINITLKKNKLEGFNGSFVASAAHGERFKANSSINLNYKKDKTTLFGSYSYTNNKVFRKLDVFREIVSDGEPTFFDQKGGFRQNDEIQNYRFGLEQKTSDKNTLLLQFNGMHDAEKELNPSKTYMMSQIGQVDSTMNSTSRALQRFNRYSFNVNNEYKIDSTGRKLTTDLDYSTFKTKHGIGYLYETYLPNNQLKYPEEEERSNSDVDIKILAIRADYVQPLGKGIFESGLKYSNVSSKNAMLFEQLESSIWVNNKNRSNTFDYTEEIAAGYADYSRQYKEWSVKLGLRAEYTLSDGISITENKRVKRDYLDFFPSAALSWNMSDNHVLSMSYSRKVTRPNYKLLNPFEQYIDKRTFERGNPYLNPQYTNGISINYTLFSAYNIAIGHDITKHAIVESLGQDSILKTTWITKENLGTQNLTYLNLVIPVRIGKKFSMYNNLTGIHMYFKGPISGHYVSQGSAFFQGNSTSNYKWNSKFSTELSMRYNTKFIYNVYEVQARFNADLGVNYNFKDQRSSLKLAFTDIFHSNHNNVFTRFNEFNSRIYQYDDSQTVRLTFNYKFGNLKQSIRRKDDSSDEKSRAM